MSHRSGAGDERAARHRQRRPIDARSCLRL